VPLTMLGKREGPFERRGRRPTRESGGKGKQCIAKVKSKKGFSEMVMGGRRESLFLTEEATLSKGGDQKTLRMGLLLVPVKKRAPGKEETIKAFRRIAYFWGLVGNREEH